MGAGCPYGSHRVLEPRGFLPQAAWRLDNSPQIFDNELRIDVSMLNVDSASFAQLMDENGRDPDRIAQAVMRIVRERGKLQNPVTGSGGMLVGRVDAVGPRYPARPGARLGARVATLVSLTLTPLRLDDILHVDVEAERVTVKGQAVVFETGVVAELPADLPETMSLAVLDVAGAPAQTSRLIGPDQVVAVLGAGGKSGLLCLAAADAARRRNGRSRGPGLLIALCRSSPGAARARRLGAADAVLDGVDATTPLVVLERFLAASGGRLADLTVNCTNVPDTEMASVLITRPGGTVYFFNMATSFTRAALGAEGIGRDVNMMIGNGFVEGHAALALDLVRNTPVLRDILMERYAGSASAQSSPDGGAAGL